MKSSAVYPGYNTIAICVIASSPWLGERLAVLVGRDADPPNEVAPHGFCGSEAAPRRDGNNRVIVILQLTAGGFGPDPFDVGARSLTDLVGEHPGEVAWA